MRRSWTAATEFQLKPRIEVAAVVFSTASETPAYAKASAFAKGYGATRRRAGAIALYLRDEPQTESWIKLAVILRPATRKASNSSSDATDARKLFPTIRTTINKSRRE